LRGKTLTLHSKLETLNAKPYLLEGLHPLHQHAASGRYQPRSVHPLPTPNDSHSGLRRDLWSLASLAVQHLHSRAGLWWPFWFWGCRCSRHGCCMLVVMLVVVKGSPPSYDGLSLWQRCSQRTCAGPWRARSWSHPRLYRCFFVFFTLGTGPRRSLNLKLSDTRVYEPQIRARLGTTASAPPTSCKDVYWSR